MEIRDGTGPSGPKKSSRRIHAQIEMMILIIVLSLVLLNPFLYSQSKENGAFEGKILFEEDQPLPGVMVTASNTSGAGTQRVALTDGNGRYRFPALLPGVYVLEAKLDGFQTARREGIRLTVGITLTVDFHMQLGKIAEKVTVAELSLTAKGGRK